MQLICLHHTVVTWFLGGKIIRRINRIKERKTHHFEAGVTQDKTESIIKL